MLCDLVKRQMYEVAVIGADLGCTMQYVTSKGCGDLKGNKKE